MLPRPFPPRGGGTAGAAIAALGPARSLPWDRPVLRLADEGIEKGSDGFLPPRPEDDLQGHRVELGPTDPPQALQRGAGHLDFREVAHPRRHAQGAAVEGDGDMPGGVFAQDRARPQTEATFTSSPSPAPFVGGKFRAVMSPMAVGRPDRAYRS